jgi:acyl carrier protein
MTTMISASDAEAWLKEKLAAKLEVPASDIPSDKFFDEFGLDSTEALILAGELEKWLGWELDTTALWYHPTIGELAVYVASEQERHENAGQA